MTTTYHIGLSVRGALRNVLALRGAITVDGKTLFYAKEIRAFLNKCLAEGKEMLPFDECDNWDWVKGCQGHKHEEQ